MGLMPLAPEPVTVSCVSRGISLRPVSKLVATAWPCSIQTVTSLSYSTACVTLDQTSQVSVASSSGSGECSSLRGL